MKLHIAFILVMISSTVFAGKPFEAPHDVSTLVQVESDLDAWSGKTLGFFGLVQEVRTSYGKPSYKIVLRNPNEGGKTLWVSSLLSLNDSGIGVGKIIRVVGFLDRTKPDDESLVFNKTGYHLLGFCFVNQETKMGYYLPAAVKQCERWEAGEHPEALKNEKP